MERISTLNLLVFTVIKQLLLVVEIYQFLFFYKTSYIYEEVNCDIAVKYANTNIA